MWTYLIFFIHKSVEGHLVVSNFWLLWITLLYTKLNQCLCGRMECHLGVYHTEWYSWVLKKINSSIQRNHLIYFRSRCTRLYSQQQCFSCSTFLQAWGILVLLNLVILTGLRWTLKVVLICISLMAKDIEVFLSHLRFLYF